MNIRSVLLSASCPAIWVGLVIGTLHGDVPRLIHYQGKLRDAAGAAVTDAIPLRFRLYPGATQTTPVLFDETHGAVTVTNGLFSVMIGSQSGGVPDSALDNVDVWLGVTIGVGAELSPRTRIASVPHAIKARSAEQLVRPDTFQTAVSVDGAGRVGVGTDVPTETLDVQGRGRFAGGVGVGRPPEGDGQLIVDQEVTSYNMLYSRNEAETHYLALDGNGFWGNGAGKQAIVSADDLALYIGDGPQENFRFTTTGWLGIGTSTPASHLTIQGGYLQIDSRDGPPDPSDCDSDSERGRMILDYTNSRVYVCNGIAGGWGYLSVTPQDPPPLYEQDFNLLANGDLDGQDLWTGDLLFDVTDADTPNEGAKHVRMTAVTDPLLEIVRTVPTVSAGRLTVSFKINSTGGTKAIRGDIRLYSDSTLLGRIHAFWSPSGGRGIQILDNNANWIDLATNIPNNTYYEVAIEFNDALQPDKYRASLNGGAWSNWYITMAPYSTVNKIAFAVSNQDGQGAGSMYFDTVLLEEVE